MGFLEKYLKPDVDGFYENQDGEMKPRSVKYIYDNVRRNKAMEQSKLPPVPISQVFSYVNEFLEQIKFGDKKIRCNLNR